MKIKFYAFFFSIFFAVLLWLLVAMANEFQITMSIPLVIDNMKESETIAYPKPEISATIQGTGWQLLLLYFTPTLKYHLSMNDINGTIITNEKLSQRMYHSGEIKILSVFPNSITLSTERKIQKTVPIIPTANLEFYEGYGGIGKITALPESVTISGAKSLVEKIQSWKTQPLTLSNIKSNVEQEVKFIDSLDNEIVLNKYSAILSLEVQPLAEKTLYDIPVTVAEVPENRKVVLLPKKIDVVIRGGVKEISSIEAKQFSASIDYKTILLDTSGFVQPTITSPENIRIINQNPAQLQYVIRKE